MGFRTGRSPSGAAWKPLNPFFRVGQPLRDTGACTARSRRAASVTLSWSGTNLRTPDGHHSLGAIHQFGATVEPMEGPGQTYRGRLLGPIRTASKGTIFLKRAVIPARPFMPMDATGRVNLPPSWAQSALQAMARALELPA